MNMNSSNRWVRQNLTKTAAALIAAVPFKRKRVAKPGAIEPSRIPATAEVARLKQV